MTSGLPIISEEELHTRYLDPSKYFLRLDSNKKPKTKEGSSNIVFFYDRVDRRSPLIKRESVEAFNLTNISAKGIAHYRQEFHVNQRVSDLQLAPKQYFQGFVGPADKCKLVSISDAYEHDLTGKIKKEYSIEIARQVIYIIMKVATKMKMYCVDVKPDNMVYRKVGNTIEVRMIDWDEWCKEQIPYSEIEHGILMCILMATHFHYYRNNILCAFFQSISSELQAKKSILKKIFFHYESYRFMGMNYFFSKELKNNEDVSVQRIFERLWRRAFKSGHASSCESTVGTNAISHRSFAMSQLTRDLRPETTHLSRYSVLHNLSELDRFNLISNSQLNHYIKFINKTTEISQRRITLPLIILWQDPYELSDTYKIMTLNSIYGTHTLVQDVTNVRLHKVYREWVHRNHFRATVTEYSHVYSISNFDLRRGFKFLLNQTSPASIIMDQFIIKPQHVPEGILIPHFDDFKKNSDILFFYNSFGDIFQYVKSTNTLSQILKFDVVGFLDLGSVEKPNHRFIMSARVVGPPNTVDSKKLSMMKLDNLLNIVMHNKLYFVA